MIGLLLYALWLTADSVPSAFAQVRYPPDNTLYGTFHHDRREIKECSVPAEGYFPFMVKIFRGKVIWSDIRGVTRPWYSIYINRHTQHYDRNNLLATGSILTPVFVLTVCTPFKDTKKIKSEVLVSPANIHGYVAPMSKEDEDNRNKFLTNQRPMTNVPSSPASDCYHQDRHVIKFYRHRKCDYSGGHPSTERYNFMVLRLKYPFWTKWPNMNYTAWSRKEYAHLPVVPTLPLSFSLEQNMELVNAFNTKRKMRCQMPRATRTDPLLEGFMKHSMLKSLPMHTECARALCRAATSNDDGEFTYLYKMATCMDDLFSFNGSLVCATVMKDEQYNYWDEGDGTNEVYADHGPEGRDIYGNLKTEFKCKDKEQVFGSPVMCRGALLGFVTGCYDYYYIIATALPAYNFILRFVTTPRLPEIFMDQVQSPDTNVYPVYYLPPLEFNEQYQLNYRERRQAVMPPPV